VQIEGSRKCILLAQGSRCPIVTGVLVTLIPPMCPAGWITIVPSRRNLCTPLDFIPSSSIRGDYLIEQTFANEDSSSRNFFTTRVSSTCIPTSLFSGTQRRHISIQVGVKPRFLRCNSYSVKQWSRESERPDHLQDLHLFHTKLLRRCHIDVSSQGNLGLFKRLSHISSPCTVASESLT